VFHHAFHITLHPGAGADYVRLHDPVPDAILAQLERAGVSDYSIFLDDVHVFGVYRYADEDRMRRELADDADPEWTAAVVALMAERPADDGVIRGLPRVFRFAGGDA
jgi:Uncharacterized conserved protein